MTEDDITQEAIDADRCIALTESGERCSRPAREDGFCYQHDEEDETILDAITADGGESDLAGELAALTANDEESSEGDGEASEADEGEEASAEEEEAEPADEEGAESAEEEAESADEEVGESAETAADEGAETSAEGDGTDIGTIRGRLEENTAELVGRPVDGVSSIHADDDGWVAVVELIERTAVPDTQDILGRYEVQLDGGGNVRGYDRLERYRRGDTKAFE